MEPDDAMLAADTSRAAAGAPNHPLQEADDDVATDDRTARRTALRDLAAMIGVEVFY